MFNMDNQSGIKIQENKVIHYAVQMLALALLLFWCFRILEPFVTPLVWGSVLAIPFTLSINDFQRD